MKKPQPPQDLWEKMDSIVGGAFKDDEGFTRAEFQERYNLGRSCANEKLRKLVAEGKLLTGKRRTADGVLPVYRPA